MEPTDLFQMRERFNQQQTMLCFNGPISRSLIEEIGNALRNYLSAESVQPSAAMDVFAVYIEMTQNIRHYARAKQWSEQEAEATVVVSRTVSGGYMVSAGNVVDAADGQALLQRIADLSGMDKAALKAVYKEQLRRPRDDDAASSGAGLGLIDMARKTSAPMRAALQPLTAQRAFFSLSVVI